MSSKKFVAKVLLRRRFRYKSNGLKGVGANDGLNYYFRERLEMPECPETIEGLQELEKLIPLCRVTLYEQAKARIETGAAKSVSEASRQIAEETGRNAESIRRRIKEEGSGRGAQLSEITGTAKHTPKPPPVALGEKEILEKAREIQSEKREAKRAEIIAKLEDIETKEIKAVQGVFDVVVIDPPWPMKKIERDERPNQSEFDYPTMTEQELSSLNIPSAADCHLWLWTTHKFLPMAFRLLDAWEFKYVCCFVWHKPGGFQPIGLPQYNCEFAVYARRGSPKFIDTKALSTCFQSPRAAHSEKPGDFYSVVRRVTAGRRLDMFNRREIDGFCGWGNEA